MRLTHPQIIALLKSADIEITEKEISIPQNYPLNIDDFHKDLFLLAIIKAHKTNNQTPELPHITYDYFKTCSINAFKKISINDKQIEAELEKLIKYRTLLSYNRMAPLQLFFFKKQVFSRKTTFDENLNAFVDLHDLSNFCSATTPQALLNLLKTENAEAKRQLDNADNFWDWKKEAVKLTYQSSYIKFFGNLIPQIGLPSYVGSAVGLYLTYQAGALPFGISLLTSAYHVISTQKRIDMENGKFKDPGVYDFEAGTVGMAVNLSLAISASYYLNSFQPLINCSTGIIASKAFPYLYLYSKNLKIDELKPEDANTINSISMLSMWLTRYLTDIFLNHYNSSLICEAAIKQFEGFYYNNCKSNCADTSVVKYFGPTTTSCSPSWWGSFFGSTTTSSSPSWWENLWERPAPTLQVKYNDIQGKCVLENNNIAYCYTK